MGFELTIFVIALLIAPPLVYGQLQGARDPEWERRWEALPQLQRDRIAAAVRNGGGLEDPEESELAVGYAREQRKLATALSHPGALHLVLGSVLLLEALFGSPLTVFSLTFLLLAFLIWVAYRDRVTRRNLARTESSAFVLGADIPVQGRTPIDL